MSLLSTDWFFNPLKFGATKISELDGLELAEFFNPLKFGATKIGMP